VWLYFVSYLSDGLDSKALIRIVISIYGPREDQNLKQREETVKTQIELTAQILLLWKNVCQVHLLTRKNLCQVRPCFSIL